MLARIRAAARGLFGHDAGNVAIVTALALPVLLGAFGLGAEAASWTADKRVLQNAADAAAMAAATDASSNYADEAAAVAAQYGLTNGANGVSITTSNNATCPGGVTGPCYSVTITKPQPLLLAQVVGYGGDATYGGSPAKLIRASATAIQDVSPRPYCVLTLGTSGVSPALRTNGAPKASLSGCNVMSNTDADCNGHNLGADFGDAHGTNDGCGITKHSNVASVADPFASRASAIPADPCGGKYPQEPTKKKGTPLPPGDNTPSGNVGWSGTYTVCGDVQLSGDIELNQNVTLVIYNGDLDFNGHAIQSGPGVSATIVFAGDNSYSHIPTGGGSLDMVAPASGPWQGLVLYQAPNLTSGVDISAAGNSPTWSLTGMAYFPHASVTFSGAVSKASFGLACFGIVADNLTINGTGSILAHGQCATAGVTLPQGLVPARGKLVS
jgi:hypothetical protein